MNRLFIEIYLDEDVDVLIARLLKGYGFAALTTADAGQLGSTDEDQLAFSSKRGMTILTHNRQHFEKLGGEWHTAGREHSGIIVAVRRSPYEIARRRLKLADQVTSDEMKNIIRYI